MENVLLFKDKQRYHSEINPVIITNLKMGGPLVDGLILHRVIALLLLCVYCLNTLLRNDMFYSKEFDY